MENEAFLDLVYGSVLLYFHDQDKQSLTSYS